MIDSNVSPSTDNRRLRSGGVVLKSVIRERDKYRVHLTDMEGRPLNVGVTAARLMSPKKFAEALLNQCGLFADGVATCSTKVWHGIVARVMSEGVAK